VPDSIVAEPAQQITESHDCLSPATFCELSDEASIMDVEDEHSHSIILNARKTYPPLIYGEPKPLVCSREYPAENLLEARPNLQIMWEYYLYDKPEGVWSEVGGVVEINGTLPENEGRWRNACTVRLSHMLNKAGHKIPRTTGKTVSGKDGSQYFFRLDEAQSYLEEVFGPPDVDFKDVAGRLIELPNDPGLLIIKFPGSGYTGHATIWNGAGTVDGVNVVGFRVLYWRLPCFIPEGRKSKLSS